MSRTERTNRLDRGAAAIGTPAREQRSRFLRWVLSALREAALCVAFSVAILTVGAITYGVLRWLASL